ncbi:MAG: exo-alpha-sialidase [Nitrospinae bacterium]|nr:exo-alpha-sialidase [Nitrospinota bacterium]
MKSLKFKVQSSKLLICIPTILLSLFTNAECMAENMSFGSQVIINHPDKRVSHAAAVMDDDGRIYLGWIREERDKNNIYIVTSIDNGKTFEEKVRVNSDSDMPAGINHPPSMAIGTKGELYIAWSTARPYGEFSTDLRFSRSLDNGRSFEPAITVNDDNLPVSHSFESMAVAPDGTIYVAWLDGREKREGVSTTYLARSINGGKTFEKNVSIDGNSCPCCRTAIAVASDGTLYVSWRKVFENNMREIVVAKSADRGMHFSESYIVGNDNWVIAGCPHRGPSLSVDRNGILYVVWYTEGGKGLPAIYIASSNNGGKSFSKKPIPYSNGTFPDHPVLALNKDGKPILAWEEITPVLGRVMFQNPSEKEIRQMNQGMRRSHDPFIYISKEGDGLMIWSQEEIRFTKTVFTLFRIKAERR